jgi:hypothetical protein
MLILIKVNIQYLGNFGNQMVYFRLNQNLKTGKRPPNYWIGYQMLIVNYILLL